MEVCNIDTYEDTTMKPSKHWKRWGKGRTGEYNEGVQGTLHICIELSQWDPLLLLVNDNSKIKFLKRPPWGSSMGNTETAFEIRFLLLKETFQ